MRCLQSGWLYPDTAGCRLLVHRILSLTIDWKPRRKSENASILNSRLPGMGLRHRIVIAGPSTVHCLERGGARQQLVKRCIQLTARYSSTNPDMRHGAAHRCGIRIKNC